MSNSRESSAARIQAYYDQTWFDYRVFWSSPQNRALHFGYWDEHTRSHGESLLNMTRQSAARAHLRPGERVLDAGCGVGGTAMWLAREYRVHVVGISIVASQVARARRYAHERGLDGLVEFEQQDFLCTRFPDASFDVVWTEESVVHSPDKPAFLREAFRVLKPGGRLMMLEYFRVRRGDSAADERLLQSWLRGWAIPDLATGDEFVAWANAAGYESVQLENIQDRVRPSHRRLFLVTMLMYPGESLLHALGIRSDVQHGNTRGARDQWRAIERGLWFEGILTAQKPVR